MPNKLQTPKYVWGFNMCSICNTERKTLGHLFHYCTSIQNFLADCLHFLWLTPQTGIFGFQDIDNDTFLIKNRTLLLFKVHIYKTRDVGFYISKIF